jgi:ketosteroid isomerase-like protein
MRAVVVLIVMVVAGCRGASSEDVAGDFQRETRVARDAIEATLTNYERWLSEGKVDSMASILTGSSYLMPPNQPAIVGRDAFLAMFRPLIGQGQWTEENTIESLVASGPLAVERGTTVVLFTPGPNAPPGTRAMVDTTKYLRHWHRVAGQWLLAEASWSSNRPAR